MADQPMMELNDGNRMPQLGFGVWQVPNEQAAWAVGQALEAGYRSIDTAALYGNEQGVGEAVATSGIPREELFVTTKLWNDRHGYDEALRAMDESLRRLGLDFVDLYLIHWPAAARDLYVETWRALSRMREEGRARSVGVSNFNVPHLQRILDETGIVPVLNQVELHPDFQQREVREFQAGHAIATEAWSPLAKGGELLRNDVILELAQKHGKTPAQIVLRWHLDSGIIVIPKSVTPERIRENIDVFDFRLEAADMEMIARLDDPGARIGPDPEVVS